MTRTVRIMAFYIFVAVPLFMFLVAGLGDKAWRVVDAIFWRAAALVLLFLLWRGVLALEALSGGSSAPAEKR